MTEKVSLEVLDPAGESLKIVEKLADRVETLDNKPIGLVWNGKPYADTLLLEIGDVLKERYPTAKTILRKISFTSVKLPPGELEAIAKDIDVAVFSAGD